LIDLQSQYTTLREAAVNYKTLDVFCGRLDRSVATEVECLSSKVGFRSENANI
jgi:hypothetical protein